MRHCESENKTLLQYSGKSNKIAVYIANYLSSYTLGSIMFLGLKRNVQVLYQHILSLMSTIKRVENALCKTVQFKKKTYAWLRLHFG